MQDHKDNKRDKLSRKHPLVIVHLLLIHCVQMILGNYTVEAVEGEVGAAARLLHNF